MAEDNTNQRVTNAVLKKDIETLGKRVEEMRDELRAGKAGTTARLKLVESHVIKCSTLWDKHDTEHKRHDIDHGRIDGEMSDIKQDVKKWSGVGGMVGGIGAILTSIFLDRTP